MVETLKNKKKRTSVSGTKLTGQKLYEEYLSSLQNTAVSYPILDKMRRSDSQIKRTLRVMVAPILSAKFDYPVDDVSDAELIKQALYKNRFFDDNQLFNWHETLNEILTMLPMGYSIFEPTFHTVDDVDLGKIITLRCLGFIKQSTINKWNIIDNQVKDINQIAINSQGISINVTIPGSELLIFTNEREGDNFEGISVLRAAYGNYVRKDLFNKIDMIGIEKMAIGTPVWYAPNSVLDVPTELAALQAIAENYVGHEQAYLILSTAFKEGGFEIVPGAYDAAAVDTAIKREDSAIVDSVLASFLNIGTARAGGNAQNEGQMDLFLSSLVYIAEYIAAILDELAHRAYVLNFGEPKTRIRMKPSGITMDDANRAMEVIRGYITAGVIKADDRLETYIRNSLNLPKADPTTAREFKTSPDYKADEDKQDASNPDKQTIPEKTNGK